MESAAIQIGEPEAYASLEAPIREDEACGDDLEDSVEFYTLEATGVFGRHTGPPETLEWRDVRKASLDLLSRSKDLRILGYLLAAVIRTDTLGDVLRLLATAGKWVEEFPEEVFPLLDGDGIARANALGCYVDPLAINAALSKTLVVSCRVNGDYSVEATVGHARDQAQDALRNAPAEEAEKLVELIDAALAGLESLQRPPAEDYPTPALEPLKLIIEGLRPVVAEICEVASEGSAEAGAGGNAQQSVSGGVPGQITSRDDAKKALEEVIKYFRSAEPSSPVPLLLKRAVRLISMPFMDVLSDLLPESVGDANNTFGIRRQEEDEED